MDAVGISPVYKRIRGYTNGQWQVGISRPDGRPVKAGDYGRLITDILRDIEFVEDGLFLARIPVEWAKELRRKGVIRKEIGNRPSYVIDAETA